MSTKRQPERIQTPLIHNVMTVGGEIYGIGGLTDHGIRKLGAAITREMLRIAKEQRAAKEAK